MYRHSMLLGLCVAATAAVMAPLGASSARTDAAMLKKIASRLDARTGVISIEASAPVPYVASQPDPRTFVVELRDIVALGFADDFTADPRHPIAAVQVESAHSADGVNVARVRMTLSHPMRPRIRSSRNTIYVEADRVDGSPSAPGMISMAGPSTMIRDVRVTQRGTATAVTLLGTARLLATSIQEPTDGPRRLVIDLPNVTSAVQNSTTIRQGPVERVRIGLNPGAPLMTQVTMDLSRQAPYRIESSPDGNDLTVVFDEPLADPISALTASPAAAPPAVRSPGGQVLPLEARGAGPADAARGASPADEVRRAAPAEGVPVARREGQAPPMAAQAPGPAQTAQAPAPAQPLLPAPAQGSPTGAQVACTPPQGTPQRYTGYPISLDFLDVDLRAVLRTFSEISGLNMVIDQTIQGTVNVNLRDVPWDQAFDIVLNSNRLGCVVEGNVVRIARRETLDAESKELLALQQSQRAVAEMRTITPRLSYALAADVAALLRSASILSQRGNATAEARTNTLIIKDLPENLTEAQALIASLDQPQPQVEIEARIVQTTRDFARRIGIQWGANGRASAALGNTLPLAFPNEGAITGRTGVTEPGAGGVSNVVDLGVLGATSGIGLALGAINGAVNLDVALTALEESGQGRILSTPRVSTQNNIEAEITQGVQIPIQTVANNTVTVTFRDAALTLRVTPQITAANTVIMRIQLENSAPDFSRAVNNIPPIDTQRANTQVLVSNGETTVIGGIYISREQATQDRTPGLHRIPLLGWLFKRNEFSDESRELLIFITPKIIRL
jgi:type IV pilus secretin PilQ/predicted competence protein